MSAELERLASACIFPGLDGLTAPDWLRRELDAGLGGVTLFSRNVRDREQLAGLTGEIRAERDDALIGIDEEGGDVTRLEVDTGSSYPGNLALGAVDDVELTGRVAASIATELVGVGVNLNLAPVADVNTNPRNPVIGVRSFGSDPELVARHVAAFVKGHQARGVIACAKHFPGHGATELDSHHELPTISIDLDELRRSELAPFRAAIEAGVAAIMTAHVVVPAVDELSATISRAHIDGLLRQELGFTGLVMTDALEMRAISATVGVDEGAVLALVAGADALCLGSDLQEDAVSQVRRAIVGAVRDGRLSEERLAEAAARVNTAGAWSRQPHSEMHAKAALDPLIGLTAARRALRVEGDVRLTGPAYVVECVPASTMAADPARHDLGRIMREFDPRSDSIRIDGAGPPAIAAYGQRIVLVVRDPQRHPWEQSLAERLLTLHPDTVVVDVGYPDWHPDGAAARITTFGASRASLTAVAERLTR